MIEPIEQQRFVIYMPKEDYRALRAKLIVNGITVSAWVRSKAKEELRKQ